MRRGWPLFFALTLHGVIDQVDNGVASIEWQRSTTFGFVPADLLPVGTGEADHIVVHLQRRQGPMTPGLELPPTLRARPWRATVTPCFKHSKGEPNERRKKP